MVATFGLPAAILLLAAVFVPIPRGMQSQTLLALFDFAHFSLAAGACWYLASRRRWPVWIAFTTVVAAAALCEVIQGYTGRCPAASDFIRGLSGALAAAICMVTLRRPLPAVRWVAISAAIAAVCAWPISEFLWAAARFCIHLTASI